MKIAAVALVCFFVGLVSVLVVVSHPVASGTALVVCVVLYPSVRRFAKMLAPVIEARAELRRANARFLDFLVDNFARCTCAYPSVFETVTGKRVCVVCNMEESKNAKAAKKISL